MARIGRGPAPGTVLRTPTGKGAGGSTGRKGSSPRKGAVPAALKKYQFKAGGGRRGKR